MDGASQSAVVVAVPAAEGAVSAHRARFDRAASWGVPAHVTVLYPFVEPSRIDQAVVETLAGAVATVPRFGVELTRTRWFGEEVLWLAPEPAAPFRALTAAVTAAFPEHPPYGGQHDDVVPHLTVGHTGTREQLRDAEREVSRHLPIRADVGTVLLMCGSDEPDSWHTVLELPLA